LHPDGYLGPLFMSDRSSLVPALPVTLTRLARPAPAKPDAKPLAYRQGPGRSYDETGLQRLEHCFEQAWGLAVSRDVRLQRDADVAQFERARLARAVIEGDALFRGSPDDLIHFALSALPEHRAGG
jgi:hypothetical protein